MKLTQYKTIEELKNDLNNAELNEAIEILQAELRRSDQAIKEGFEEAWFRWN